MNDGRNNSKFLGRDHHPRCFTMWMAGAGPAGFDAERHSTRLPNRAARYFGHIRIWLDRRHLSRSNR